MAGGAGYVLAHPGQRPEDYLQSGSFWRAVGVGAASGGVAGVVGFAVGGLSFGGGLGGAIAGGIVSGAFAGGAGQITANLLTPCVNWYDNVAEAAVFGGMIGGITGGVGYGIGRLAPEGIGNIAPPTNASAIPGGRQPGPTIDPRTGAEVKQFIVDSQGNVLIEPVGGSTTGSSSGQFIQTRYPNGSYYQRYDAGHPGLPGAAGGPHGHGYLLGTGSRPNQAGPTIDVLGNIVPSDSPPAHWFAY